MKRKCNKCGSTVKQVATVYQQRQKTTGFGEKYIYLGETETINNRPQQIGEPILVNPNSYVNVSVILEKLREYLGIGKSREWTYIGCDGPPYCLASRLIERNPELYDWAVVLPGLGHLNMNQVKSYFQV